MAAELRVATEVNNPRRLHTQNLHTTLALSSHSPHRSFNKSSQHVPPESSRIFTLPSQESSKNHQRIFRYIPHRTFRESLQSLHTSLTASSQNLQRALAEPHRIFTESSQKLQRMLTEASKMPHLIFTEPSKNLHNAFTRVFRKSSENLQIFLAEPSENLCRVCTQSLTASSQNLQRVFREL